MPRLCRLLCLAVCAAPALALATPPNTLSTAEQKSGWKLLWDGKTTDGWRNYQGKGVSSGWKIENGALVREGDKAGDLITDKQYDNFELQLQFKIEKGGNSGVLF